MSQQFHIGIAMPLTPLFNRLQKLRGKFEKAPKGELFDEKTEISCRGLFNRCNTFLWHCCMFEYYTFHSEYTVSSTPE
jgi:hypothetical protein